MHCAETIDQRDRQTDGQTRTDTVLLPGPILSVFFALIVHSELKSVHPGFPVAFIFKHKLSLINK